MKIACLDDSTAQLGVYKVLFRSHDVKLYSDPDAFLLELEEFLPDLIILDLIMPYMCGTEVCERIRKNNKTKDIRIVFITGLEGEEYNLLVTSCGGNGLINKGNYTELKEELNKWML
jgi:PleD family two-component response regulator